MGLRLLAAALAALLALAANAEEVLRSDILRQAQRALATHGHPAGGADGIMGARTEQALREFQLERGLTVTGELNHETLGALGVTRDLGERSAATGGSARDAPRKRQRD